MVLVSDLIDRELNQTISEVSDIYERLVDLGYDEIAAGLLTLATVTHHQNGTKP